MSVSHNQVRPDSKRMVENFNEDPQKEKSLEFTANNQNHEVHHIAKHEDENRPLENQEKPLIAINHQIDNNLNSEEAHIALKSPTSGGKFFSDNKHYRKIDLEWENLEITAIINKKKIVNGKTIKVREEKPILHKVSGSAKHGRFTAIMGPSGGGKTTLLNFLSARITGTNLRINGDIRVNGQPLRSLDNMSNLLAYVMQDDILTATMTPREALTFVANLRITGTLQDKREKVEELLKELGLTEVANTPIGNNLIRGISGGERKRTSIGVELITNPSMVFLDEPTTGLDSKTAENVITTLFNLAKNGGRTIVSTIHQPSSQIFNLFDNLMLLVRGNIIYQGSAQQAVSYFSNIGFVCPKLTNPADYFMKIMNESGILLDELDKNQGKKAIRALQMKEEEIEAKFLDRLDYFKKSYFESSMPEETRSGICTDHIELGKHFAVGWCKQFWYLLIRKLQDEFRNPMELKVKLLQTIFFGLVIDIVFNKLGTGQQGIQNRNGVLFFYVSMGVFGGFQASVGTFSAERPIFIRERLNKTYATSAYFWAKSFAEYPLNFLTSVLFVAVSYYVIKLDSPGWKFVLQIVVQACVNITSSGYGLLASTFIPSMETAMAMTPVIIIPMMLFGGFFVTLDHIAKYFYPIVYISPFKYGFQAATQIEYQDLEFGCPGCDPTANLREQSIALSIGVLIILSFAVRVIAYLGLRFISTPKRPKIHSSINSKPESPKANHKKSKK